MITEIKTRTAYRIIKDTDPNDFGCLRSPAFSVPCYYVYKWRDGEWQIVGLNNGTSHSQYDAGHKCLRDARETIKEDMNATDEAVAMTGYTTAYEQASQPTNMQLTDKHIALSKTREEARAAKKAEEDEKKENMTDEDNLAKIQSMKAIRAFHLPRRERLEELNIQLGRIVK